MGRNPIASPDFRFEYAVSILLKHEGGFVNNKNDTGGATNYGISLRYLKASGIDINLDGRIDITDIMALDKTNAKAIYKKYWWDKYKYDLINNLLIATKIFDLAVNMGASQSHKLAQRAANICGKKLEVDGRLGKQTIAVINNLCQTDQDGILLNEIKKQACAFYTGLTSVNPDLTEFLKGWLRRARD